MQRSFLRGRPTKAESLEHLGGELAAQIHLAAKDRADRLKKLLSGALLRDVSVRAREQGAFDSVGIAVCRENDYGQIGMACPHLANQVEAVPVFQREIHNDNVRLEAGDEFERS